MDGRIWFLSLYIDIYILYKPYMDMNKCILLYTNRMFVLLTFLFLEYLKKKISAFKIVLHVYKYIVFPSQ